MALRRYWDFLSRLGRGYSYFSNSEKTILLTKPDQLPEAESLFVGRGITIRSDGCRHLGGALGTPDFCQAYLESMADWWHADLQNLSEMAQTQAHAAYAVFSKGLSSR